MDLMNSHIVRTVFGELKRTRYWKAQKYQGGRGRRINIDDRRTLRRVEEITRGEMFRRHIGEQGQEGRHSRVKESSIVENLGLEKYSFAIKGKGN